LGIKLGAAAVVPTLLGSNPLGMSLLEQAAKQAGAIGGIAGSQMGVGQNLNDIASSLGIDPSLLGGSTQKNQ
jgi:hypothetical protein